MFFGATFISLEVSRNLYEDVKKFCQEIFY